MSSTRQRKGSTTSSAPTLVVGATGRVGRRVVQQLLQEGRPVRALVRNSIKADEVFGGSGSLHPKLEIVVADISRFEQHDSLLEKAVMGCGSIISVSGATRVSKLTDFLPWRLFGSDVSSWAGRDHPYFSSYLAQKRLIDLAAKHQVQRFVRLTGVSQSFSAWNPFNIMINTLLSCSQRYTKLCELALTESKVPYVILRPGGLSDDARNETATHLQVEPSGALPFPSRIGRDDVATLCIAATDGSGILPADDSYILACRWVGACGSKPQGTMNDGFAIASACLKQLVKSNFSPPSYPSMKPYRLTVAVTFYSFVFVALKAVLWLWRTTKKVSSS